MMISAVGASDIGCKRKANEDRILVEGEESIFVVADGMGGQRCGGRAAELATLAFQEYFQMASSQLDSRYSSNQNGLLDHSKEMMATAIQFANERIFRESDFMEDCTGMGCTISAVKIDRDVATIGNVGDSRVYLYRMEQLVQLTRDDSVIANLLASGEITPEEVPSHPMRNMLTQSVGTKETVEIQLMELKLVQGDRLLLCSDGLHGVIGDTVIEQILSSENDAETAVRALIAEARNRGGPDNISSVVIDYSQ
jgi:protein phosphatase